MKKKILLVDDDKQLNYINEKVLFGAGLVNEVHTASNGKEAIDFICARVEKDYSLPDLIVLDLYMPVMDGFEFIDEFQKLDFPGKSAITIVIFTDSSNPKDRQKANARGIKYYLNKPYLLRGLNDVLHKMEFVENVSGQNSIRQQEQLK